MSFRELNCEFTRTALGEGNTHTNRALFIYIDLRMKFYRAVCRCAINYDGNCILFV